jgi:hypothetical protein
MAEQLVCPECGSTDTYTDQIPVPLYQGDKRTILGSNHCRACEARAERVGGRIEYRLDDPWAHLRVTVS